MARARDLRLWALAVLAVGLLAAGAGHAEGAAAAAGASVPRPAAAVLSTTADIAVLPGRAVEEIRSGGSAGPSRVLVLGVVLTSLLGLPALARPRPLPAGRGAEPLHIRRHAIALRAPPAPVRRLP